MNVLSLQAQSQRRQLLEAAREKEARAKAAELTRFKAACAFLSHEIRNLLFPQSLIIEEVSQHKR